MTVRFKSDKNRHERLLDISHSQSEEKRRKEREEEEEEEDNIYNEYIWKE